MRKSVVLLVLLFPQVLFAQFLTPQGCYSPDSDPFTCYTGQIDCGTSSYFNEQQLGYAVGSLCDDYVATEDNWLSCEDDLDEVTSQYNGCSVAFAQCADDNASLTNQYNSCLNDVVVASTNFDICVDDYNGLVFDYNLLVDQYNIKNNDLAACQGSFAAGIAAIDERDFLIARLKKKVKRLRKKLKRR